MLQQINEQLIFDIFFSYDNCENKCSRKHITFTVGSTLHKAIT